MLLAESAHGAIGEKFAAFTYLHSDAQNPICGTAHNVASPEMLNVTAAAAHNLMNALERCAEVKISCRPSMLPRARSVSNTTHLQWCDNHREAEPAHRRQGPSGFVHCSQNACATEGAPSEAPAFPSASENTDTG